MTAVLVNLPSEVEATLRREAEVDGISLSELLTRLATEAATQAETWRALRERLGRRVGDDPRAALARLDAER